MHFRFGDCLEVQKKKKFLGLGNNGVGVDKCIDQAFFLQMIAQFLDRPITCFRNIYFVCSSSRQVSMEFRKNCIFYCWRVCYVCCNHFRPN